MKKSTNKKKPLLIIEEDEIKNNENINNEVVIHEVVEKLELNKIYNEDCILGMKKIKSETVDVIICDPPYNIGKDF